MSDNNEKSYMVKVVIRGSDRSKVESIHPDLTPDQIYRLGQFMFSLSAEKRTGIPASCSPPGEGKAT